MWGSVKQASGSVRHEAVAFHHTVHASAGDESADSRRRVARSRERRASDVARPCGNIEHAPRKADGDAAWQADREGREVPADGGDRAAAAGGVRDARVLARGAAGTSPADLVRSEPT